MSANIEAIKKKQQELDELKQKAINEQLQVIKQAQNVLVELGYKANSGRGRKPGTKNKPKEGTNKATKKAEKKGGE